MYWFVPSLPELSYALSIPPVVVESPVTETHQFTDEIHEGMEPKIKPQQPEEVVRKLWREGGREEGRGEGGREREREKGHAI